MIKPDKNTYGRCIQHKNYMFMTGPVDPEPLVLSEEAKEAIRAEFEWQISYGMYGIPHPKYPMHWRYL